MARAWQSKFCPAAGFSLKPCGSLCNFTDESNAISGEPATSQTGQFVAYRSSATNLDSDRCDRGINQIYVSDRSTGTLLRVSQLERCR